MAVLKSFSEVPDCRRVFAIVVDIVRSHLKNTTAKLLLCLVCNLGFDMLRMPSAKSQPFQFSQSIVCQVRVGLGPA